MPGIVVGVLRLGCSVCLLESYAAADFPSGSEHKSAKLAPEPAPPTVRSTPCPCQRQLDTRPLAALVAPLFHQLSTVPGCLSHAMQLYQHTP
jgi:hypothetical protein